MRGVGHVVDSREECGTHEVCEAAERDEVGVDERHHLVAVGEEALDANANLREGWARERR